MHTIIVDDEQMAINSLLRLLKEVDPGGLHTGVRYVDEFMQYVEEKYPDIAFIDVDLYGLDGITLTRKLSKSLPNMNIVLYTGHPEFKPEALDLFVSGYLVKPVSREELEKVLAHLRHPIRSIRVQCFGHFEVYVNEHPVKFDRKDSKEVFAYLVDRRGAEVSDDELRYLLWSEDEDTDKKRNYIHNIIYDIRSSFAQYGVQDVIYSRRGHYSVDVNAIKCDYYDYLAGKHVRTAILGEYMEQFNSWSSATKFKLFR